MIGSNQVRSVFSLLTVIFIVGLPLCLDAEEGRWIRQAPRIIPVEGKYEFSNSIGAYSKYTINTSSISVDMKEMLSVTSSGSYEQINVHVFSWKFTFTFGSPPAEMVPGRIYTFKVNGSGNGVIKITNEQSWSKWSRNVKQPEAIFSLKSEGMDVKSDTPHGNLGRHPIYVLNPQNCPGHNTFSLNIPVGRERMSRYKKITLSAGIAGKVVEWDYLFGQGSTPVSNQDVDTPGLVDCGKSGLLTRYLGSLRDHNQLLGDLERELDGMLARAEEDSLRIVNFGQKALSAGNAYLKTLISFRQAETRRGLFEELNLLVNTTLTLNQIGVKYRKLAGAPVIPLDESTLRKKQNAVVRTVLNIAKQRIAARFESEGLRDIITSESWGEALDKAVYHADRKVKEFLERETQKIFGLGFYDARSAHRALRLHMRREIYRQVAKLLVKVTSNTIIIELVAGPIIRWIEGNLWPRLREALRPKGNLKNRVEVSVGTLRTARSDLYKLPCTARLREVRQTLSKARAAVHATRYLERDLRKASNIEGLNRLSDALGNLIRAISITTKRFLMHKDDYEQDLAFIINLVRQMLLDLKGAIPESGVTRDQNQIPPPSERFRYHEDNQIPSLNATVVRLNFYEGGYDGIAYNQRNYQTEFSKSQSRFIYWELYLKHPAPGRRTDFKIAAIYYNPDGSVFGSHENNTYLKADWIDSYHQYALGWSDPGNWKPGKYRVELFIEGKKVAGGEFEVVPF